MKWTKGAFVVLLLTVLVLQGGPVGAIDHGHARKFTTDPPLHKAELEVYLTYPNGSAVKGGRVEFFNYFHSYETEYGITNGTGVALLSISGLNWGPGYILSRDGGMDFFDRRDIYVNPGESITIDIQLVGKLPDEYSVTGTLRRKDRGSPIGSIPVSVSGTDVMGREFMNSVTTGMNGKFSIQFPETSEMVLLKASDPGMTYSPLSIPFMTIPSRKVYNMDLWMREEGSGQGGMVIDLVNSSTGSDIDKGLVYIDGYDSNMDHSSGSAMIDYNSTTGLWEGNRGQGEYIMTWYSAYDRSSNVSYFLYHPFIYNGTEDVITFTVPIPLELRNVTAEVWNETAPLHNVWVGFYIEIIHVNGMSFSMRGGSYTNSEGVSYFGIPKGKDVTITFSRSGYEYTSTIIDGGSSEEEVRLNLTMSREGETPDPSGELELHVIDPSTGVGIPSMDVVGYGYEGTSKGLFFSGLTDDSGYLNITVEPGVYENIQGYCSLGRFEIPEVEIYPDVVKVLTGTLGRWELPADPVEVHFKVLSETGEPLPNIPIWMEPADDPSGLPFVHSSSDNSGTVTFRVPPGDYIPISAWDFDEHWEYRSRWAAVPATYSVGDLGGQLPDLVMVPTDPIYSIEGTVIDMETGKPIPFANVNENSFRSHFETPSRQPSTWYPWIGEVISPYRGIELFRMRTYSDSRGFFRVWGREATFIDIEADGYFPRKMEFEDIGSGPNRWDAYLEPMAPRDTWMNGTLVDVDGGPIEGIVVMIDTAHDNMTLDTVNVNLTGSFSIPAYPGSFRIIFGNDTIHDEMYIDLGEEGLEGLELKLIPRSEVIGRVEDWKGTGLPSIPIKVETVDLGSPVVETISGTEGDFHLRLPEGTYRIVIEDLEDYNRYLGEPIILDGWKGIELTITLSNRSSGSIKGKVLGDAWMFTSGVPDCLVELYIGNSSTPETNTTTDMNGSFSFHNIEYGSGYWMMAYPPESLKYIEGSRSGYDRNTSMVYFTVDRTEVDVDIVLPYKVYVPERYLHIMYYGPLGTDVLLDQSIMLSFSEPMDPETFPDHFSINPPVPGLFFLWNVQETGVTISHDPFNSTTDYTIAIGAEVRSADGYPLIGSGGLEWNFTTGTGEGAWRIDSLEVAVLDNGDVEVNAEGPGDLTVYFIIEYLGSYGLEEIDQGNYRWVIPFEDLEPETTYGYHLSDREGGEDLSPGLSGTFTSAQETEDEDTDGKETRWELWAGIILVVMIIIIAAVIIVVIMRRRGFGLEELEE
ncbi:MAG: Ig-like domain-containing protein [Thermoplasmatota archaeon]